MGAPFEGDIGGKGLLDEMPDWVTQQIDMDDYVDYLKPPVGTWDGKTYRITIDGDCHTFAYRKDYSRADRQGWTDGDRHDRGAPKTWQQVQASQVPQGQDRPADRPGRLRLSSIRSRPGAASASTSSRTAPAPTPSIPDDKAWLFDPDTMKPRVNNPAWVQAIQDVMDLIAADAYPQDQINADPEPPPSSSSSPAPARC